MQHNEVDCSQIQLNRILLSRGENKSARGGDTEILAKGRVQALMGGGTMRRLDGEVPPPNPDIGQFVKPVNHYSSRISWCGHPVTFITGNV